MQLQLLQRHYSFESYWVFEAFDALLTQQLATGYVVAVASPQAASVPSSYQPDAYYQLSDTQEIWALSTPDTAWRGYFLPLTEALVYQKKLRRQNQRSKVGCLLVLLVVGVVIVWQSIKLFLNSLPTVSP